MGGMVREVLEKEKTHFNKLAAHPTQTWEWGEFRRKTGVEISRLGRFEKGKLVEVVCLTWHKVPRLPVWIGYVPRSGILSPEMIKAIKLEAVRRKAVMVKMEPNIVRDEISDLRFQKLSDEFDLRRGRPMFTKWTFWVDISQSEEGLLARMKQKTRYNVRLAERKGVKVTEGNSDESFEDYWKLTEETTKRQGFYAHTKRYHRLMWEEMTKTKRAHMLRAEYEGKVLATWVLFYLNGVLYYPYGASSSLHREVMASNLMMWSAMKLGKKLGAKKFDLWGSTGPNADEKDPWYGFHRFKEGYGGELVEMVGTYDLVISPVLYELYRIGNDKLRWWLLRLKAKLVVRR